MMSQSVQSLARELYYALETRTRDNGEDFVALKDGSPEWMRDVIHAAHGDMLPDDVRYGMIETAASAIMDSSDRRDGPLDAIHEVEAPIYTHELASWLDSRADRYHYVDDALAESGYTPRTEYRYGSHDEDFGSDILTRLSLGWLAEFQETAYALMMALADYATELENDESEDES